MSGLLTIVRKELLEVWSDAGREWMSLLVAVFFILFAAGIGLVTLLAHVDLWAWGVIVIFPPFTMLAVLFFTQESYSGERERHTLETLLAAPISERSVLIGKVLAHFIIGITGAIGILLAVWIPALFVEGTPNAPPGRALLFTLVLVLHMFLLAETFGLFTGQRAPTVAAGNALTMPLFSIPMILMVMFFVGGADTWFRPEGAAWIEGLPTMIAQIVPYFVITTYLLMGLLVPLILWKNKAHRLLGR